ncbi:MAG: DUF1269 domain-containing protein [Hyphomonadaceae bacterium]|nr:DUF1269 domain-containing protein [Hyphomonadaceae bacterium]
MSAKVIVLLFNDKRGALSAAAQLRWLKDEGDADFTLHAGVVVAKDARGKLSLLRQKARPALGVGIGALCGALLGLIGGPVGVAVGAGTGAVVGLSSDVIRSELDDDFVAGIMRDLKPGNAAIIMEALEGSVTTIDNIVAEHHGRVTRQDVF